MKKIITKIGLFLSFLFIFILASCSNQFEIGFNYNGNGLTTWKAGFKLALKCSKKTNENQTIDVYYGNTYLVSNVIESNELTDWSNSDFNQKLKFSIYRYVLPNNTIIINAEEREEIFNFEEELDYFINDKFNFGSFVFNDKIDRKILNKEYSSGKIYYKFEIIPIEDEYIKLYCVAHQNYVYKNGEEVIPVNKGDLVGPDSPYSIKSFESNSCGFKYKINDKGITFNVS